MSEDVSFLDVQLTEKTAIAEAGGKEKYHAKNSEAGKMFCRERLNLLFDNGLEIEDGKYKSMFSWNRFGKLVCKVSIGRCIHRKKVSSCKRARK